MYEYLFYSYSIFIHNSKNMSSELKHSLSSISQSDDELKPSISITGCFRLFGRAGNLFLTGPQRPSTSIQPCPKGDGWLYTLGCNVWKIISSFIMMIKGVVIKIQSKRWFVFHAFPFNWPGFSRSFAFAVSIYRLDDESFYHFAYWVW